MIDLKKEKPIRLKAAGADVVFASATGKPAGTTTMWRIASRGTKVKSGEYVKLETIRLNGVQPVAPAVVGDNTDADLAELQAAGLA